MTDTKDTDILEKAKMGKEDTGNVNKANSDVLRLIFTNPLLVVIMALFGGFGGQSIFGVSKEQLDSRFVIITDKQNQMLENQKTQQQVVEELRKEVTSLKDRTTKMELQLDNLKGK